MMNTLRAVAGHICLLVAWGLVLCALLSPCSAIVQAKEDAAKSREKLAQCEANLKDIAAAIEKFANEHNATYPKALNELVPKYLKSIPPCPAAGKDTYSRSYKGKTSVSFKSREASDASGNYIIYCCGHNHKALAIPSNYPQYLSGDGLHETPVKK